MSNNQSDTDDENNEDALDHDDGPEFAKGHLADELTQSAIYLAQAQLRVINLVIQSLNHLCLLTDFLPEVLVLVLQNLADHGDLVEVAVLTLDVPLLHLHKLFVISAFQVNDIFTSEYWFVTPANVSLQSVRTWLSSRLVDQMLHVRDTLLDQLNHWISRQLYIYQFFHTLFKESLCA